MIKVIEQENRYNIEVGLYGSCDVIILTHGNDLYRSGISIEKSKAREVALAICPELESELKEAVELIERLKRRKLVHQLFIGKVADILSIEKVQELLRESNESLNK